ncbi:MAG: class I SAM-dependent methyltransferase [Planctomycetaceae bacterium]|nr:class I SAM-dependent methyltransferase [Planctomycetaceae bacterium]
MAERAAVKVDPLVVRVARRCLRATPWCPESLRLPANNHPASLWWRIGRFLLASSKDHAFLDRGWVSPLLRCVPRRFRAPLAMRLLSLSPHYWVYQWTNLYPKSASRREILMAEYDRNAVSRKEICDAVLLRFLNPAMTVMDFGCGPGFLAKAVSEHVAHVVASDVSRGVIACAREINGADNLEYVTNGLSDLGNVADASLDLVYSFAVFQHLTKTQSMAFFREFARVLKPGAQAVCHVILKEPGEPRADDPSQGGWITRRVNLRMVYFTPAEMTAALQEAGLRDVNIIPVSSLGKVHDDIGKEQLMTFRR